MHPNNAQSNGSSETLQVLEHTVTHLKAITQNLSSYLERSNTTKPSFAIEAFVGHTLTHRIHQLVEEKGKLAHQKKLRSDTKEYAKSLKRKREEHEEEERLRKERIRIIHTHKKGTCHACGCPFLQGNNCTKRTIVAASAAATLTGVEAEKRGHGSAIAFKEDEEDSKVIRHPERTSEPVGRRERRKHWMKQIQRRLDLDRARRKQRAPTPLTPAIGSAQAPRAADKAPEVLAEWEVYECRRCTRRTCIEKSPSATAESSRVASQENQLQNISKPVVESAITLPSNAIQPERSVQVSSQQTSKSNRKRRKQGSSSLEALLQAKHKDDAARQAQSFDLLDFMNSSG